jgi:hypothetical protein
MPFVIRVTLVGGKVFTHNCDTGKLSALIQYCNIVHQIESDGFQRCQTHILVHTTLTFLTLQGTPYIYDISRLRVKCVIQNKWTCLLTRGYGYSEEASLSRTLWRTRCRRVYGSVVSKISLRSEWVNKWMQERMNVHIMRNVQLGCVH